MSHYQAPSPLATSVFRTAEQRAKAQMLRLQKKSIHEIAEELEVSESRVRTLLKEALEDLKELTVEDADDWRRIITQECLEQLEKAKTLRDKSSDPAVIVAGMTAVDRQLKLLGNIWVGNRPQQVQLVPSGGAAKVSQNALENMPTETLHQLAQMMLSMQAPAEKQE